MNRLYEIAEHCGGHGFDDDGGTKSKAGIVAPLCREFHEAFLREVPCRLRFVYGGSGLECHAEKEIVAVGETAVDSSGPVFRQLSVFSERVVVLGAAHVRGREAVAELDAANSGDGEYGMGNERFHRVEIWLAKPDRKPFHAALHDASYGVPISDRGINQTLPQGLVGSSADPYQFSGDFNIRNVGCQDLLGNDACRDESEGHSAGEYAAAGERRELTGGGHAISLRVSHIVHMPRARDIANSP